MFLWLLLASALVHAQDGNEPVSFKLIGYYLNQNTSQPMFVKGSNAPVPVPDFEVSKLDIRVETGLFFDVNKDYDDDDCEEKKDDCGWWFWPFDIDQSSVTSERPSIPEQNMITYADTNTHGLFAGKNLDVEDLVESNTKLVFTPNNLTTTEPPRVTYNHHGYRNGTRGTENASNSSNTFTNHSYGYLNDTKTYANCLEYDELESPGNHNLPYAKSALILTILMTFLI